MQKLYVLLAVLLVSAHGADVDSQSTGITPNNTIFANGTNNCVIISMISEMYNNQLSPQLSANGSNLTYRQVREIQWVLSFELQFISEAAGGSAQNRYRFQKGASATLNQLEKKNASLKNNTELAQKYQKWFLTPEGYIKTAFNNYSLAVEDANIYPGARVIMWPVYPGTNLKWRMDNWGRIVSQMAGTNVCLEVTADLRDGTALKVRTAAVNAQPIAFQQWFVQCEN